APGRRGGGLEGDEPPIGERGTGETRADLRIRREAPPEHDREQRRGDGAHERRAHHRSARGTTCATSTVASKCRGSSACLRSSSRATGSGGSALSRPCSKRTTSPS